MATTLPIDMESTAIRASGTYHWASSEGSVATKIRPTAAKAAALVATDMKVVTMVGAPS